MRVFCVRSCDTGWDQMAGNELLQLLSGGVPGGALLGYALYRIVDRVMFVFGLRIVLRNTRQQDRVAAITAYNNGARSARRPRGRRQRPPR
jgi:hypothetical protein